MSRFINKLFAEQIQHLFVELLGILKLFNGYVLVLFVCGHRTGPQDDLVSGEEGSFCDAEERRSGRSGLFLVYLDQFALVHEGRNVVDDLIGCIYSLKSIIDEFPDDGIFSL